MKIVACPIATSNHLRLTFLAICGIAFASNAVLAQSDDLKTPPGFTDQQLEFFENKVRPLLVDKCYDCHGPDSKPIEGSLNLASRKSILVGGDTGPAIVAGHPDKSLLIDAINYGDVYEMPPDTKMSDEEIDILTEWVKQGAPWPTALDVEVATKSEFDVESRKAEHWCWQPIRKPSVPKITNLTWPKDSIDNFVLARLESAGLTPAEPAERRTLIRRAYFDIIGLPPTPNQVAKFLADQSPAAFEKVVDELLASPQFGERWARHWMDLTRYAETCGHEFDYAIPYAFRYRDYLIRAFNSDVSYKQLVTEHIAGDLVPKPRRHPIEDFDESILGTGFWFLGEAKHAAVDSKGEEARTIDNQIDVMSKTFLGLTVACARCHDHKFDAISTEDYYALSGFLQSSRRQAAMLDPGRMIEKSFDKSARLVLQGDQVVQELLKQLENADETIAANYIDASLEFLRSNPDWNRRPPILIEGESLKQLSVSSGETKHEKSNRKNPEAWSGNKQYLWQNGSAGDSWVLEFDVPDSSEPYLVAPVFSKSPEYGSARILVNDQVVHDRVDFVDSKLTTASLSLNPLQLKAGKNQLKIVLLQRPKDERSSNKIGIDCIKISPVEKAPENEIPTVQGLADSRKLDRDLLKQFVNAIKDPATESTAHPFHLLFRASRKSQALDSSFSDEITKSASASSVNHQRWIENSTLYEDFENGLPPDWFRTGFAFGDGSDSVAMIQPIFSAAGQLLNEPGTIQSGRFGANLFGVIRSPTFEITNTHIHYRCRGKNVTIRLIIDGNTMDSFNALLYAGCRFNIANSPSFHWETQARDIKNHVGKRAHIEIIDHGDGHITLDEIRFSNGANPADPPDVTTRELVIQAFDSTASFAKSMAAAFVGHQDPDRKVASWILEKELVGVFAPKNIKKIKSQPSSELGFVNIDTPVAVSISESNGKLDSIRNQLAKVDSATPAPLLGLAITDGTGEEEQVFIRGNHKTPGKVATRRFLSAISNRPLNPPDGSGRLKLANKITAPNNPLTTRVAVNRIWHHMLGKGIVESVDNFGVLGKLPSHPELLDFLATEFASDGQSVKRMIKRIALTQTYQMASHPSETGSKIDPDNDLLHRARIRRLEGEAIRDSILQVSGRLDLKMYGPSIPIYLTPFMDGRGRPGKSGPLDGAGRRSIYISVRRNFLSPMMLAFDTPIPFNSTGARNRSNVPAQALILMNDPFVVEQSEHWAKQLILADQSNQARIVSIFETALGRSPTDQETKDIKDFLVRQATERKISESEVSSNEEIWQDVCHIVFNMKEFIFIQ